MAKRGLTPKQERFVQEYLIDLNATQASIRAGYSPRTANEQASRLLANVGVGAAVSKALAERSRRVGVNQDRVMRELGRLLLARMDHVAEWQADGTLRVRPTEELDEDTLAAIQEISSTETVLSANKQQTLLSRKLKVKLHDKGRALSLLMEHLGMIGKVQNPGAVPNLSLTLNLNLQDIIREEVQKAMAGRPLSLEEIGSRFPLPGPPAGFRAGG